jgi:FG-GAP-like repeat
MKLSWSRIACLVPAAVLTVGCKGLDVSPRQGSLPAPMHYTAARDGLPTGKIWKSHIAFGDVNGDGFPDIGAVSRLADGPWIWIGDGKGHWTEAKSGLPTESFCGGGMKFGDANNDGKMDVAIADHCRGAYVYFGDGAGHWTNASSGLPTMGAEDIAVGDFNHDGCLDVAIVAAGEEGVHAFTGNCKGVWKESSNGLPHSEWGNAIKMADVNGDGNLDIVAAYAAGPRVWLGDGKGNWREASEGLPAPDIHGLYWGIDVGDVNGDGRLDIVSGAAVPGVEVFIQDKNGKFHNTASTQCAGGSKRGNFCIEDSDCPGSSCAGAVCKGTCTTGAAGKSCKKDADCAGATCSPQGICSVPAAGKSCLDDKECPGSSCKQGPKAGLACTLGGAQDQCGSDVCSAVSNTHGIPAMNALGVAFGDLNNDGKLDLVVAGKTNLEEIGGVYGVFPLLGDGAGNWTLIENTGLPTTGKERTWGIGVADIDNDGVLDIAVAFGDVLSPTWRSGPKAAEAAKEAAKEKGKAEGEAKPATPEKRGPDRGFFGSIEVWRGQLTGK